MNQIEGTHVSISSKKLNALYGAVINLIFIFLFERASWLLLEVCVILYFLFYFPIE